VSSHWTKHQVRWLENVGRVPKTATIVTILWPCLPHPARAKVNRDTLWPVIRTRGTLLLMHPGNRSNRVYAQTEASNFETVESKSSRRHHHMPGGTRSRRMRAKTLIGPSHPCNHRTGRHGHQGAQQQSSFRVAFNPLG
jgi:hypothetical protein